ncbi:hypothetical protein G3N59_02280 [Paraburkholderia sp. Ac-20340]|uniref:hypothetical protein n=1 Tax=Paraburkholderia sp. Ac-20340 TaxID=2703888 RepID=UPI00197E73D1|nr:hypothetical protein [Paraburkholderia sp. Ac-20340]MBN3852200.1 hypothetical protein [Paraburkholderia sp. Ac-20340]
MRFLLNSVPDARKRFVPYRSRTIPVHGAVQSDAVARPARNIESAHNATHYIETSRNAMNNKKAARRESLRSRKTGRLSYEAPQTPCDSRI